MCRTDTRTTHLTVADIKSSEKVSFSDVLFPNPAIVYITSSVRKKEIGKRAGNGTVKLEASKDKRHKGQIDKNLKYDL